MVTRVGGFRRKTRHKFKKSVRNRGKLRLTRYFQELKQGDKVLLKADSAFQDGMYYPRFHGKSGIIEEKRGTCYRIKIKDFNKEKTVTVHPVHLIKQA